MEPHYNLVLCRNQSSKHSKTYKPAYDIQVNNNNTRNECQMKQSTIDK